MANSIEFQELQKRYEELSAQLASGQLNHSERLPLQKEHSYLSKILEQQKVINELEATIQDTKQQAEQTDDPELKELFKDEAEHLEEELKKAKDALEEFLFPPDELDNLPVFIEIRAGAGGQEAALFVADLLRAYSNYALKKGWDVAIVDSNQTDLKGFKEVVAQVKGKGAYGHFKYESGVHRVQRVPATETAGRVHTSTITVAVFPEISDDIGIEISPTDLRIDYYRAGGAGGQHVNKTESAVRITHLPTGIVVACQDDRSQHKNKAKAMKMLQSRILVAQREKQQEEMRQKRKEMMGSGMRAEKVRTYNYPQNRVTDHNAEITLNKLDFVMEGALDEIIDALREKEQQDRRKQPIDFLKK